MRVCQRRQRGDYTRLPLKEKMTVARYAMRGSEKYWRVTLRLLVAGCALFGAQLAFGQASDAPKQDTPKTDAHAIATPAPHGALAAESHEREHRFWDRENVWLFAGVGAARTLDYFSTLNMRRRGRQEILLTNYVVDNHAAFAAVEASATGVSIGAAYLFHRYGHHKLERWTSFVHIGLTTTGAVRNYCLKTAHFMTAQQTP